MKRYFFIFFIFLYFFGIIHASPVSAASNFFTDYNTQYHVLENGITNVTFDVTLTNRTSQNYASSYSINLGFTNIEDVIAKDPSGVIKSKVVTNNNGNSINLDFNKKVVGINQKLPFSVSFSTSDIANKSGKIWDINIPGLAQ